tara:strand:+ start:1285 stop:3117 length:1833 start_codon:yes stop_codon:yes gene_type:complete
MAKNIEVTLTLDSRNFDRKMAKSQASMKGFGAGAATAKGSVIGLAARFAPLALGIVAVGAAFKSVGSVLSTASGFQDVQVTLSNLIGSAEGGAAALAKIKLIAQDLPFEFEQLAAAAPAITTVSGTIGELEDNMRLAADIAANFGIPFDVAAGQIQRSFSAGAGAADVFREKGVLSAAGFQAGVTYSIDETQKKLREFGGTIEGSADQLNNTLTGALSQTSDRFTAFRDSIGQAMLPTFQVFLQSLVGVFDQNKVAIENFGNAIGQGVVKAFKQMLTGGAVVVDFISMLLRMFRTLAMFIDDKFGDVIGSVMNFAVKAIGGVVEAVAFLGGAIGKLVSFTTGNDDMLNFFNNIEAAANKARTGGLERIKETFEDLGNAVPVTTAQDFIANLLKNVEDGAIKIEEAQIAINKKLAETGDDTLIQIAQSTSKTMEQLSQQFGGYADGALEVLKTFEQSTLKLSDDLATALMSGQSTGEAFKTYFKSLVTDMIAQALRLAIIQPLLSSIFGAQFGAGGKISGFEGGMFNIGGKANGGSVMKNRPYIVGERGPELFTPGSSGQITPNNALGGGSTQPVTYNINAVDARSFKQLVASDPEFIYNITRVGQRRLPG